MKKVAIIAVIALVVLGCVLAAGCTSQDSANQTAQTNNPVALAVGQTTTPTTTTTPQMTGQITTPTTTTGNVDITPAVTIIVPTIEGTFYNVGNIASIVLPENGTTGYQWNITSQDKNLNIRDVGYQAAESTTATTADGKTLHLVGTGGKHTYWLTSEKAGTYKFTLKYMRSWEDESKAAAVYNGTITFKDESDKAIFPNGPSTSFVFDTANINPKAGEYFKIVIPKGNATTGYTWKATGSGLTIIDDYIVDDHEEGMVGVGGTTVFYVKADKAGTYTLKAEYGRSWENSPIEAFEINLTFI